MSETTIERRPNSLPPSEKRPSRPAWKRPWVWALAAVVLVCAVAGGVFVLRSHGSATPTATPRHNPPATAPQGQQPLAQPGVADIGKPTSDGGFAFDVTGYDCSTVTAQGKLCLVHIKATNAGTAAQTLAADAQLLVGSTGSTYHVDAAASAKSPLLRPVPAGQSATGDLAFVVPPGAHLTKLELHSPSSSQGATVQLP